MSRRTRPQGAGTQPSGTARGRPGLRGLAAGSTLILTAGLLVVGSPGTAAQQSVPVFTVLQEGLTRDEGEALAEAFGIPNALETTGAFSFVDTSFGDVPQKEVGKGEDESGRPTVAHAIDLAALDQIKPISDDEALQKASRLVELAKLSPELEAKPSISHTELTLADANNRPVRTQALDTAVSYDFSLAGLPVGGQGARLRITFDPGGKVTQLSHALRKVERAGTVPVIDVAEATRACAALYPRGVQQLPPTLGYQFPELGANQADGRGTVRTIFPQYTCNPVAETGALAHRIVPAVPGAGPKGKLTAWRDGDKVEAKFSVEGGSAPYTYSWSSSTTVLSEQLTGEAIAYQREVRDKAETGEQVTVEVTDANGLTATATVSLDHDGEASAEAVPGGGGYGTLAVGPVDVGIEQTVDEWACAQASANGFRSVMNSRGVPVAFDWRGYTAWEKDFKEPSLGGNDSTYVDNVDAAWYTGHGWPGGFTFKANVTDRWIVPEDARWGNRDLEWLQLESCQVLRDTTGTLDYFSRWRQVFQGLHMLNGFHTNAYCVGGGTGRTFAEYLFPKEFLWWTLRPAQRVRVAWAKMAIEKEPRGVVYRSMGPWRVSDGVSSINDYFWGQGPVSPDLPVGPGVGLWSVTGTV